jgi:hypothetical protein
MMINKWILLVASIALTFIDSPVFAQDSSSPDALTSSAPGQESNNNSSPIYQGDPAVTNKNQTGTAKDLQSAMLEVEKAH